MYHEWKWECEDGVGSAYAELDIMPDSIVILTFRAEPKRMGYGSLAVRELKAIFRFWKLIASNIGSEGTESHGFWMRMLEKGLVDEVKE